MQIRLAGIVGNSIVDGPGLRYTIFAQGCPFHCVGCHNPHTHDFNGGKLYETDELIEQIRRDPLLDGVTFSGGEPFCQPEAFCEIAEKLGGDYSIVCYTGYDFEELLASAAENGAVRELLSRTDILIDGRYDERLRSLELKFKGSKNQRVINAKESVKIGKAVEIEF